MRLILATLICLLALGYAALVALYPGVSWLQSPLLAIAWPAAAALLCLVLLAFGKRLNPRDPVLPGWVAFSLCGCLLVVPLLVAKSRQEAIDADQAALVASLREDVRAMLRRQAQAALDQVNAARASRPKDRFTQYEGRVDALALERIRILDTEMQAAFKEKADAYRQALEENRTLGPNSWLTFRTLEELEAEREAHQRLYAAARGFTQFVESFEQAYTDAVIALQLKPPGDRIAVAEMERVLQSLEAENAYDLRKLDVETIGAALSALNVLHDAWGSWSYSPREQTLSFDDPAREAAFHQALQRLKAATEAVQALTQGTNDPDSPDL
jgi:hypothetical protein